jgi:hypothetical protein
VSAEIEIRGGGQVAAGLVASLIPVTSTGMREVGGSSGVSSQMCALRKAGYGFRYQTSSAPDHLKHPIFHQHLLRRRMAQKTRWAGAGAIGARLQDGEEIAGLELG